MIEDFIAAKIRENFPFEPTEEQNSLIESLGAFLTSYEQQKAFLLTGYAGTGKTSIVAALVKTLKQLNQSPILLAPTGRAAKVLSSYSQSPAYTIHRKIFRQKSASNFSFQLNFNKEKHRLFIVDEASMIANSGFDSSFGSGRLLDDLMRFVYSGEGCSLLLLGDTAQLPPVGQDSSPALNPDILSGYGLKLTLFSLTHVLRQALTSGILHNATLLRQRLSRNDYFTPPRFEEKRFPDITRINGIELIDQIQQSYGELGLEECAIITRSNKRANMYNQGIRQRVLMREEELANGDLLMITRNNYFWCAEYKEIDFIANGDILEVKRIRGHHEMYGFRFVDLTLYSIDYEWEIDARICLDSLHSESPKEANELNQKLFEAVGEDYPEITDKRKKAKKIMESEFYNALHAKFAYAITCHKAQGGQWKHIFIDQGKIDDENMNQNYFRWIYTAITRASERVFFLGFSDEFFS